MFLWTSCSSSFSTVQQKGGSITYLLSLPLLLLLLLFLHVSSVSSLTCSKYTSSVKLNEKAFPYNEDYSPKRTYFGAPASCDALLKDQVFFVPQNGTEKEDVEQQAFSSGFGLGALEDECRIPATRYLCAYAFRRCELQPFSPSLPNFLVFPLPRPPSRKLCEDFVEGCSSTGLSLPNCTEIDSTGLPVYPKGKATFVIAGVGTFMIPSEDYEEIDNLTKLRLEPVVCPYPLEYREGHTPTCQLTCPHSNLYTREEWEKVDPIRLYLSIVSFVLDIWTLITLITIKERRVFPANLGIAACFIHAIWMVFFIVGGAIGIENLGCINKFENADSWGNPTIMCGIEGFMIFFTTLCICLIWTAIALSLFCFVVLEKKSKDVVKLGIPSYLISFGVPLIFTTILWAGNWLGHNTGQPWCWTTSDGFSVGFFWTWIGFLFFTVMVCLISSIIKMIMVKRKLMSLRRAFQRHINVIVFCLGFTLVYGWHWSTWLWLRVNRSDLEDAAYDWVLCNSASGGQNNCDLTFRFSIEKMYFQVGVTAGSGLFIFLSWGCSPRYLNHWRRQLLPLLFTGQWRKLRNMSIESMIDTDGSTNQMGGTNSKGMRSKGSSSSAQSPRG